MSIGVDVSKLNVAMVACCVQDCKCPIVTVLCQDKMKVIQMSRKFPVLQPGRKGFVDICHEFCSKGHL